MLNQIRKSLKDFLEKVLEEEDDESKLHRIESARISSTRLKSLERINERKVVAASILEDVAEELDVAEEDNLEQLPEWYRASMTSN